MLAPLLCQFLIQISKEAHHPLVYLVVDLLLNVWRERCGVIHLAVVKVIDLWRRASVSWVVATWVLLIILRYVMAYMAQLSRIYHLNGVGVELIWAVTHWLVQRWPVVVSLGWSLLLILTWRIPSRELFSHMIGLDILLLGPKDILIFIT